MPAEWDRHTSTWLSWPKNPLTFPPEVIDRVESIYVEMIEALTMGEKVDLLVDDRRAEDHVRSMIKTKGVRFHTVPSADVWMRDYGPIFVKRSNAIAITKWEFNAWGKKYDDLLPDDKTGLEVSRSLGVKIFEPGMVLEGGSIDLNGRGLLLTTEQCLLNRNRNPGLTRQDIETRLRDFLGVKEILWLKSGIAGDDTDGHVDDIARFVNKDTVVCMVENDPGDENHETLRINHDLLSSYRSPTDGSRLNLVPLQMPSRVESDGRLPASYANFYIGNAVVLLPVFGQRSDEAAIAALSEAFPDRKVVPIDCKALIYGFGGIHCVTQQQPKV